MRKLILFTAILALPSFGQDNKELDFSIFDSIQLNNGKKIDFQTKVERIHLSSDRVNKVDYVELLEGTVVDSYDIKEIFLRDKDKDGSNIIEAGPKTVTKKLLGDGSGG